jgi:hypothetical protein
MRLLSFAEVKTCSHARTAHNWVIIIANGVSLTLLACILYFKLRNKDS